MRILHACKIYEEAEVRLKELQKYKEDILRKLEKAPSGSLSIVKQQNHVIYYLRTEKKQKNGIHIPIKETTKIKSYAQKKYYEKALKYIEKEIKQLDKLINSVNTCPNKLRDLYSSFPEHTKKLITPVDINDDEYISRWESIPYEGKSIEEGANTQHTEKGEIVRSKSEANIANALYKARIPYKYECPLKLKNGYTIYPDFTILDIKNRRVVYWEHRGMMDDRSYAIHTVERIKDYQGSGIFLGDNLMITEETMKSQLTTREISQIIKKFFE